MLARIGVIVKLWFLVLLKLRSHIITHPKVTNDGAPSKLWKPLKCTVETGITPENMSQTLTSYYHPLNQWLLGTTNGSPLHPPVTLYTFSVPLCIPSAPLLCPLHTPLHPPTCPLCACVPVPLYAPLHTPLYPLCASCAPSMPSSAPLYTPLWTLHTPPCHSPHPCPLLDPFMPLCAPSTPLCAPSMPPVLSLVRISKWF